MHTYYKTTYMPRGISIIKNAKVYNINFTKTKNLPGCDNEGN